MQSRSLRGAESGSRAGVTDVCRLCFIEVEFWGGRGWTALARNPGASFASQSCPCRYPQLPRKIGLLRLTRANGEIRQIYNSGPAVLVSPLRIVSL